MLLMGNFLKELTLDCVCSRTYLGQWKSITKNHQNLNLAFNLNVVCDRVETK